MSFVHQLKVALKRALPEAMVSAILRMKWEKMKLIDLTSLELLRKSSLETITDATQLESLLPLLGLNNEALYQMPEELYPFTGKGLLHWQYPKQFSKYLVLLSKLNVESYLEIGVRHGGTFVITVEYLTRLHPLKKAVGLDRGYSPSVVNYSKKTRNTRFFQVDTQTERFTDMLKKERWFDCVLIDGNHDEEACRNDYEAVKDKAGVIVLHDIVSDICPGVQTLWKNLKEEINDFIFYDFTEQYKSVMEKTGQQFFGLGIAVKKSYLRRKCINLSE